MADGPSKAIVNFPGGRWHLSNKAREAGRALATARKGVTYAEYIKSAGEIIQLADRKSGAPIGDILLVVGTRIDEESWDEPPPRFIQAIKLQIEPGQLSYDPTHTLELPNAQAIRRFGRITGATLNTFLETFRDAEERRRALQRWGHPEEEIQRIISAPEISELQQVDDKPPSALSHLKNALKAIGKGRIF